MPRTKAEQKAYERQRDKEAGMGELRGVKAPLKHHEAIKAQVRALIADKYTGVEK